MAQTAPGWPPAGHPPVPPAGGGGGGRPGRTRLIAIVIGVIVLVGSGLGTFALAGGFTSEEAPADAPDGAVPAAGAESLIKVGRSEPCESAVAEGHYLDCFPSLHIADVADALTAKGYQCAPNGTAAAEATGDTSAVDEKLWACRLEAGANQYEASISGAKDDRIWLLQARVAYPVDSQPSDGTMEYLSWIASLPYADDAPTVAEVSGWLAEQVEGGENAAARIGGFEYELEFLDEGAALGETWIWLTIQGT